MDRLEAGRVGAGKSFGYILELDARPGRIGVAMDDPHQIGPIRTIQLAGDLDRYPLARTRREPVEITDQRDHSPNLGPLYLRIRTIMPNKDATACTWFSVPYVVVNTP